MFKNYPQHIKKFAPEDIDSADEIEASLDEVDLPSRKLPESNIKLNPSRFSGSGLTAEKEPLKIRKNSPLREKNPNTQAKYYSHITNENEKSTKIPSNQIPKSLTANKPANKGPSRNTASPTSENLNPYHNKENARDDESNLSHSKLYNDPGVSAYTELAAKIYNQKFSSNPLARQIKVTDNTAEKNLLLSEAEAQKINEKRYFASKDQQEDVVERLLKQGEIMAEHTKALTNEYLSREVDECPFVPQIRSNKPRRNFDEFLEDQRRKQVESEIKKREKMEQQAQLKRAKEDASYKPTICQKSVKLLQQRKGSTQTREPAYQRLYSMGKNSQMKHMRVLVEKEDTYNQDRTSVESSQFIGTGGSKGADTSSYFSQDKGAQSREIPRFTPSIQKKSKNLRREGKVENLLYNDALRRQNKTQEVTKTQSKGPTTRGMSLMSKRALAIRFIKEFDIAILEFLEVGKEPKLNYLKLNELLKKLCFLKESSENVENPHFTPERLLLYDAWYLLQADKYQGIHRRNLLVFLLGILSLHFPITKIQPHEEEEKEEEEKNEEDEEDHNNEDDFKDPVYPEGEGMTPRERKVIGCFDEEGNYELTEEDVRKLHKEYELWYLNRLCSGDNLGQLISMRTQQEHSHQPVINESSRNLAQNYREKMLEGTAELIQQNKIPAPKDGKITHVDLLIVSKKVLAEKVNRYGELIKQEQARDWTFKPQTNQYDQNMSSSKMHDMSQEYRSEKRQRTTPAESLGRERVFELHSLAKPHILKKDRSALEVDFEKNIGECTFQPNTNKQSKTLSTEPAEIYAKGIEKTIERMRIARAEKEQLMMMKERGFTTGGERNFVFEIEKSKFAKKKEEREANLQRRVYEEDYASAQTGASEHPEGENTEEGRDNEYGERDDYMMYSSNKQHQGQFNRNVNYGIDQNNGLNEVEEVENEAEDNYPGGNRYMQQEGEENHHEGQPHFQRDIEEGNEEGNEEEEQERVPLLFVDVNLGQGRTERIVVYEGDKSENLAREFAEQHNLDPSMKIKLKELLDSQIASLLSQIDEELNSETERYQQSGNYVQDQIQEEDDYVEEESYGGRR